MGVSRTTRVGDLLDKLDESIPPVLAHTLKVINQLQAEGLIESYAIGGSVANYLLL